MREELEYVSFTAGLLLLLIGGIHLYGIVVRSRCVVDILAEEEEHVE